MGFTRGLKSSRAHSFAGGRDLFLPYVTRMHSKLQDAGGTGTLSVACGRFHVCVSAIGIREARQVSDDAAAVIAHSQV
jgi:hypothetical protein